MKWPYGEATGVADETWAIETEHLTKVYGGEVIAVNDLSFRVPRKVIFGFLGPNGAGKTTTLRLLLGLQRPTAGRAWIFGHACGPQSVTVRRLVGYLPTNPRFPGHLKPFEYLDLVGQLYRMPADVRRPRIASLLRAVGLLGVADQRIATLSTGETTRLGIAASLVGDPLLLLWDEPTAGLDPAARRFALDLIRELGRERTILVATHILADIDQVCTHVGVMHEGRMIFCGPIAEMKRRLRGDSFFLDLEGTEENLRQLAGMLAALPVVSAQWLDPRRVRIAVNGEVSRAEALAEVLRRVDQAGVVLHGVQTGLGATEDAYLQLLQEDELHGFTRFQDAPRPAASHPSTGQA
ncbi:MAG: ABC transporter ATP-binding protein [Thermogutta sp.]|uniref:ABC transporter ATP-binding protein n=1 Tax=Thermogutta sp. TaxID=1962930 RepID=UPI0019859C3F|nr:ABC transporter ATP-binding protein [Thermogutta sp.]MBC7353826.1 ABC transporter ATP-binding protein [Thermogutta sp.]